MALFGDWQDCVITIASDDDLSAEVDLGRACDYLMVKIPTIDSANLTLYSAEAAGGTYTAQGNSIVAAAGTGAYTDLWLLGGLQHIKIGTSASQTANRTFRVRGVRS